MNPWNSLSSAFGNVPETKQKKSPKKVSQRTFVLRMQHICDAPESCLSFSCQMAPLLNRNLFPLDNLNLTSLHYLFYLLQGKQTRLPRCNTKRKKKEVNSHIVHNQMLHRNLGMTSAFARHPG